MLRSFTTLARHLNLTRAVEELGSTRQTVRRHITYLEQAKGFELFRIRDRRYELTERGASALTEAQTLLSRGNAWLSSEVGFEYGMLRIAKSEGDWRFFLQQRPLSEIWVQGSDFLRNSVRCWAESGGNIEHPAFQPVRPYAMVFRPNDRQWVCVDVGRESSFATWFGWEWQSSSIGRTLEALPGGPLVGDIMEGTFHEIAANHGLRFDHIHTTVARKAGTPLVPLSYTRLLLGARFPDDSFALVNIIERTNALEIDELPPEYINSMDSSLEMHVSI
ncbi:MULTISPECIES: LysR family transcriptional regulator [Roseobacteraceae]|uniref:Uncharacterized protein n=1 Tax=Pseudosulfitobacter pseudonitzschiae TaxID=1402135 RepID=A0A073JBL6_9RHOB|nr:MULTISPECIES: LysR family transcriptional regulator [Roseobacteraceae]KEJ95127.1 hypothetical protein SUH3_23780 [Pseudosulfitobacter pseudonitzschiae]MBM1838089.1 LysR family transcriptional regulator [Pseudosulfitobacter pseudonitzschiae]MBM1843350.1 LysR family transcriptional regulator [Pseudosulfitobacter pseudonitzschiae]MBM1848216.1 LysR family transcriptional regulator [Pseudosulfitobacter pseudonitzschiae]MBM1852644.1 LysR family transcriptional regulator [Pseudosulfitobacter pseud|tara:strand:+ start:5828 stop:6658 length:831 start_codon:yes stop_codon:yes gene_type:complete